MAIRKLKQSLKGKLQKILSFFNIEYNMFIDEYRMTPEQFLSSDKNEN